MPNKIKDLADLRMPKAHNKYYFSIYSNLAQSLQSVQSTQSVQFQL